MKINHRILTAIDRGIVNQVELVEMLSVDIYSLILLLENGFLEMAKSGAMKLTEKGVSQLNRMDDELNIDRTRNLIQEELKGERR